MLINGIKYHVELQGNGTPLILLHGFTGSTQSWQPHIEEFSHQYQTIAVDLLGHGKTESPAAPSLYRMEHAAQDIIELLKAISPEPAHLLGYSMGGRLALYLAVFYPQYFRSLILESASPGLESAQHRQERIASDEALALKIEREGIEKFVEYWENIPLFATQNNEIRIKLRQQRLQNNPIGLANSLRGIGTGVQPSLWDKLPEIQMPVLLITGDLDKKFTEMGQQMQKLIPNAKQVIIPNAGHTVHLEHPEIFSQTVLDAIR